jgi:glycosyltransferase involved in cell wall biosynthesis
MRTNVLSIVVPALNEESAIGDTIRRCLAAKPRLLAGGLADVEVIVVSDGSTDRTEEIARGFDSVTVLVFEKNRGYGAAIKCGFEHGRGDLVGFLDADGTCDPEIFGALCRAVREEGAAVAIGSRMGAQSEMPPLRRLGNRIFAWILGVLSKSRVRDTASGMRVIRRSALSDLYPLPDGLHFTPAMSARVLLEDKLKLVEVPMPYAERIGRSKLSVVKDGLRFLRVIVRAAVCYRPDRLLMPLAVAAGLAAALVGALPVGFYLQRARLEEWMVYRILLASLLMGMSMIGACTALVADRIAVMAHRRSHVKQVGLDLFARLFERRVRLPLAIVAGAGALAVVWPGMLQYVTTGHVGMHWSRAVLSAGVVGLVTVYLATSFLLDMLGLIMIQREGLSLIRPPDRIRRASPDAVAS